jgi:ribosomal protein L32
MNLGFLFRLAAGTATNAAFGAAIDKMDELGQVGVGAAGVGGMSAHAESKVGFLEEHVRRLEADLAKALMISETLWELLRDKTGLTDDDLCRKIHEVDMRDGRLDKKNQRKAVACPRCGRMVSTRHRACLYCGQVIDTSAFSL